MQPKLIASLALSCVQAQLWARSTVTATVREGDEGTLPTENQKIIRDNAVEFEREFQSWWHLVNFTCNPIECKAKALALTKSNGLEHGIYSAIALGLNHHGTILYPLEHRVWAQQNKNKGQTVDGNACVV